MSDTIKGIMTVDGVKPIDYEALANLPTIDSIPTANSTNAVQSGAVHDALATKLDAKDGKAADSILFDGKTSEYYATAEKVQNIADVLGLNTEGDTQTSEVISGITTDLEDLQKKFNQTGQALDAEKFGGEYPNYYATKQAVDDAQLTANNANSLANQAMTNLASCWIEFTDEDGNPTDEPYIHWAVDENGMPISAGLKYAETTEF